MGIFHQWFFSGRQKAVSHLSPRLVCIKGIETDVNSLTSQSMTTNISKWRESWIYSRCSITICGMRMKLLGWNYHKSSESQVKPPCQFQEWNDWARNFYLLSTQERWKQNPLPYLKQQFPVMTNIPTIWNYLLFVGRFICQSLSNGKLHRGGSLSSPCHRHSHVSAEGGSEGTMPRRKVRPLLSCFLLRWPHPVAVLNAIWIKELWCYIN